MSISQWEGMYRIDKKTVNQIVNITIKGNGLLQRAIPFYCYDPETSHSPV